MDRKRTNINFQYLKALTLTCAIMLFGSFTSAVGSGHYTDRQLAALATRIGRTFWVIAVDGRTPMFLSAPNAQARSFRPPGNESFEILELVGRAAKNPYYKVKFASGQEGYLRAETFLEEFNATIVTHDPLAEERKKSAERNAEEKKRVEWIQAQPWTAAVKESAINRQPVYGMTGDEVKKVLGAPSRVSRVKSRQSAPEEQWIYPEAVLVFRNGILSRIDDKKPKE